jgi:hypothetical protein
MMASVAYLAGVVVLEGWPVIYYLRGRMEGSGGVEVWPVAAGLGGAALLTALAILLPLRAGVAKVRSADF